MARTKKTHKEYQVRQGDVLVRQIKALPENLPSALARDARKRVILAAGEVTGHHHAIADADVEGYEVDGKIFLRLCGDVEACVKDCVVIEHEEHAPLKLPTAFPFYESRVKLEFDPLRIRKVQD